jgi:LacI family transcriptional regulator
MVTILDVARLAGVSPSTVSHVLNGKRPISDGTKLRVHQAIQELGYEPNPHAQALRGSAAGVIGFLASDITEFFSTLIIQGVEQAMLDKNMYLLFTSVTEFGNRPDEALAFLGKRRIDGLIVSFGVRRRIVFEGLDKLKIPVVTINTSMGGSIPSVEPDDFLGGGDAALHLLSRGARRPALIAGPKGRLASDDRVAGFIEAFTKAGGNFDIRRHLTYGDFTVASGEKGLHDVLDSDKNIDALFCANDYMAAGAINAARELGIDVPNSLKVVGFDNRDFGEFWTIPISTFQLPLYHIGHRSAELLLDRMDGRTSDDIHLFLPSTLIPRQSS